MLLALLIELSNVGGLKHFRLLRFLSHFLERRYRVSLPTIHTRASFWPKEYLLMEKKWQEESNAGDCLLNNRAYPGEKQCCCIQVVCLHKLQQEITTLVLSTIKQGTMSKPTWGDSYCFRSLSPFVLFFKGFHLLLLLLLLLVH